MISELLFRLNRTLLRHRWLSLTSLVIAVGGMILLASSLSFEEDITKLIPTRESTKDIEKVLKTVKFTDKLIINITKDEEGTVDDLTEYARQFIDSVEHTSAPFIQSIQGVVDMDEISNTVDFVYDNLPLFLNEKDYDEIAGRLEKDSLRAINLANYKALISPSGMVMKKSIRRDPLGLSFKALEKLRDISLGDEFTLHDGFLVSKDHEHLVLFISPTYNSDQTAENFEFAEDLYRINNHLNEKFEKRVHSEYFGSILIAVANAHQIKRDIRVSVSIAIGILLILLIFFFRRISISFILFIPSAVGGLAAISVLYLLREQISAISLGIGSVMLGVTLDYSLHILTHIRNKGDLRGMYKEVAGSVLVSSLTTASAFLCLLFIQSQALQDLGIFCAVAVVAASLIALLYIPLLYTPQDTRTDKDTFIDRSAEYPVHQKKWALITLVIGLLISSVTYSKVRFNNDLSQMNYFPAHLEEAQLRLDELTKVASKSIYVVAYDEEEGKALRANDEIFKKLSALKDSGRIMDFSSIGALLNSTEAQQEKLERWKAFWTEESKGRLQEDLISTGEELGFRADTYSQFYAHLDKDFRSLGSSEYATLGAIQLDDFLTKKNDLTTVTNLVNVDKEQLAKVREMFNGMDHVLTIDRQQMKEAFLGDLKNDFNELVLISLGIVIVLLLLFFRSISLTLVTGIPVMVTWLLTLGVMGLVGLELNIFNIVICTFIFGLGIDYCIFITQGLLHELREGKGHLGTYKTSILLSVITTLLGVGVLIFAEHPALLSISKVSIIGILSAVFVSFILQPWLFRLLIGSSRSRPVSIRMFLHAIVSFTYFGLGGLLLSLVSSILIPIIPVSRKVKMNLLHRIISAFKKSVLYSNPFVKKTIINESGAELQEQAIIIANHTSFLDILAIGMLHPRIIFLVNDWVYNSPIFGRVVRMVGGYPVSSGLDNGVDHLREKVRQGYSIAIFPEGTRSMNQGVHRFHKGAFYLAQEFDLDILPVMIHGNAQVLPKGTFVIRDGAITLKALPRIRPGDAMREGTLRQITKTINADFRSRYHAFRRDQEKDGYFRSEVLDEYRYRDPVTYRELKRASTERLDIKSLIPEAMDRKSILVSSQRSGVTTLLAALEAPNSKIYSFIADEKEREIVERSCIAYRHGNIISITEESETQGLYVDLWIQDGLTLDKVDAAQRVTRE